MDALDEDIEDIDDEFPDMNDEERACSLERRQGQSGKSFGRCAMSGPPPTIH